MSKDSTKVAAAQQKLLDCYNQVAKKVANNRIEDMLEKDLQQSFDKAMKAQGIKGY